MCTCGNQARRASQMPSSGDQESRPQRSEQTPQKRSKKRRRPPASTSLSPRKRQDTEKEETEKEESYRSKQQANSDMFTNLLNSPDQYYEQDGTWVRLPPTPPSAPPTPARQSKKRSKKSKDKKKRKKRKKCQDKDTSARDSKYHDKDDDFDRPAGFV